mmetsp:Transcript_32329/g.51550  ORF Transcript_32329/g.51550 Transcript_32329/m.51550 type:complete len:117 (-) Transcript_32329:196-546(-)
MHRFMCRLACLVSVAARSPLLDTDEVAQVEDLATLLLMNQPRVPLRTNRDVDVARRPVMSPKRAAISTMAEEKEEIPLDFERVIGVYAPVALLFLLAFLGFIGPFPPLFKAIFGSL